ncbi:UDP-N-acetylmuramoyl-L-alanyl-D-glutamate--2,6-diaminopimelate ligase [Sediminibacillus massiliensis]|uniref:UDP-N-acetylmuramoyl-L-alanyl-D-glutamate--2, 6-diaminopimelate ligase n=1 Tax=Sediminibacillus massiliensis TaxID=1926277 RepID=UPI0009889083|nr:UDP-N-acetylmuramoyl-L-alanyl-D-glutamate--2,6-diaminopimelate ligase [Sediminibacillus massiliensis]
MKLSQIAEALHIYTSIPQNLGHTDITGLQMDSRNIKKGDLFICINGLTADGHDFARQAEEKGAAAIVAEKPLDVRIPVIMVRDTVRAMAILSNKFFDYPTDKLRLIGVTGTNGKTSVTYLLESIMREHRHKLGLIGTIQMKIDNQCFNVKNTTPDSLFLQKSFHKMVERQIDTAIMEVSSHALSMGRVFGCDFNIAVYTNLSQDHLDYHTSMEDYFRAKSLLFSQLGNSYDSIEPKFAVINLDDHYSQRLMNSTSQPVITYGIYSEADVVASNIRLGAEGVKFTLRYVREELKISSRLMGKFSIYNMLAAASAAICAGVPLHTIKKALEKTNGISGRFEPVTEGQAFGVIVDYAHTPDSLENVLMTIQSFAKGRVIVVIGCGGDRDRSKRPLMGKVASKLSDLAIFTSDNPRTEKPAAILEDMIQGLDRDNFLVVEDRRSAIIKAINHAQEEDIVLIAGKGHETYQLVNGNIIDFDDRKVAAEAIQKKLTKEK